MSNMISEQLKQVCGEINALMTKADNDNQSLSEEEQELLEQLEIERDDLVARLFYH